jgi:rare lipoprotein A (peptidoglycan hydrolase)
VRTRFIVAIAALMAASALVAAPEPAGSRVASPDRAIDTASLSALTVPLPASSTATSIPALDPATRSAGWLGPDTSLAEPGLVASVITRPRVKAPKVEVHAQAKNYWRFDGNISWYGPGFYGHQTACGVAYTQTVIGVASRTLPCGTLVTFRNSASGRVVTAPVIDRGPYVTGRTWDMSAGLCAALSHCYTGTIEWRWGGGGG